MADEEYDWIFDFVLQFLESDRFDAAVMDFVDEKCDIFDDEEENKFIYTDIHREFCEHVEALIDSNLGEVGISTEMFVDSCEKARNSRDINSTVFERLVAMDDFQTFKKIMTKRNTQLHMESLQSFKAMTSVSSKFNKSFTSTKSDEKSEDNDESFVSFESLPDPEELRMLKESSFDWEAIQQLEDEDIQDFLFQSLMEMELIHRQEELEHAELERALTLSLVIEEDRLRELISDSKESTSFAPSEATPAKAQSKELLISESKQSEEAMDSKAEAKTARSARKVNSSLEPLFGSELKPLKLRGEMKPLPSIASPANMKLAEELEDKKRAAEDSLRRNQEQLSLQRRKEEELRKHITGIDPLEAERRAKHMREQRDLLVQKKKEERERKVQLESERRTKIEADLASELPDAVQRIRQQQQLQQQQQGGEGKTSDEELAEMRRATMRMALARRMKHTLAEDAKQAEESSKGEDGGNGVGNSTLQNLEKIEQKGEQLREDNKKREYILNKQLERQQAQIARNVRISAATLAGGDDDV